MTAPVALVLVSHSARLAEGARELAAQMAPDVLIVAAGGNGTGEQGDAGLGTSFDLVESALLEATADGRSAVVLTDLGSAVLTTESVVEMLDEGVAVRVHLASAPFVEAAVAAAVTAAGGAPVGEVLGAATAAGASFAHDGNAAGTPVEGGEGAREIPTPHASGDQETVITAHVLVRNPMGLHARPAAVLARMMAGFDAAVQVDGVNGASVLELMQLGATQGRTLEVSATGPQARVAVDAFVGAVEEGFGEA
jgi:phosphoenolpyruvate---glycerone phosphotransferase subunit DhaM